MVVGVCLSSHAMQAVATKKRQRENADERQLGEENDIFDAEYHDVNEEVRNLRLLLLPQLKNRRLESELLHQFQKRVTPENMVSRDQLVNALDEEHGETLLMWAAERGESDLCRALIDAGARVDDQSHAGRTALYSAASHGMASPCKLLRTRGAKAAARTFKDNPLLAAAKNNFEAVCIELLPYAGTLLNQANSQGFTPLLYAIHNSNERLVRSFIELGAQVNQVTRKHKTTLMLALQQIAQKKASLGILRTLLAASVDVNAVDSEGKTALMYAADEGLAEAAVLLLNHGALIHMTDKQGKTAFHYAARTSRHHVIQILLFYSLPWRENVMFTYLNSLRARAALDGQLSLPHLFYTQRKNFIKPLLDQQKAYVRDLLEQQDGTGKTPHEYLATTPYLDPTKLDETVKKIRKLTSINELQPPRPKSVQSTLNIKNGMFEIKRGL